MIIYDTCHTKIGNLRFTFDKNDQLRRIVLTDDHWHTITAKHTTKRSHELGKSVCQQFRQYFVGNIRQFDIPFKLKGTPFQKQVWNALLQIPYGQIKTYTDVAAFIERPYAIRAVGRAIAVNPLPILIPCHRVIGRNKKLTGYAGGVEMKKQLLEIEGNSISDEAAISI
ncbi:methylated-DNA--[protein]-cysteine S-methyltransferase [Pseudogracilibacillus sp. SO30301A]|uniref:methylated-DNA--[protein]-cysteine S-methyltransferase n=1 Tax=Pseudogracilibacillus sp. SO30301A TaxID=3098291 RepID=UPI00300E1A5D